MFIKNLFLYSDPSLGWALYVNTLGLPNPLGFCIGYADRRVGLVQGHEAGNRIAKEQADAPLNRGSGCPELYVRYQKSGGAVRQ